ncbi:MAG: hypothetical protein L0H70_06990 [Xanthomonadales bacterium]|nr:hypothetical protein [Xanthomonadales bacterium]
MALIYKRGLTLRLDPISLQQHGARCTRELDSMASAQHDFVCLGTDAKGGYWLPLSATPQIGCQAIPASAKSGDRRWADAPSYYQPDQCWYATHKAVQLAAAAAHDRSNAKATNSIAADALPDTAAFTEINSS